MNFHILGDKKHHVKALLLSLIVHVSVFLIFLGISDRVIQANKPLIIDFSTEGSEGEGKRSSGVETTIQKNKRGSRSTVHRRDVKGNKTEVGKKEIAVEQSKPVNLSNTPIKQSANVETEKPFLIPVEGNMRFTNEGDIITLSALVEAPSGSAWGGLFSKGNMGGMGTGFTGQSGHGSGGVGHGGKAKYLKKNFSYIRDLIQKRVVYPRIARRMGWQGRVKVSFIIFSDGFAKDVNIIQTSGIEVLDRSAVKAVKEASPFPKPPCEAQIIIPLVYKLN